MKKARSEDTQREMKDEYDFSKMKDGERGKYYRAYREGHTVEIVREDGGREIRTFQPEEGAVMLDPDVREFFPDAESVNRALRSLIRLIPERRKTSPAD